jgi:hypothetical protein
MTSPDTETQEVDKSVQIKKTRSWKNRKKHYRTSQQLILNSAATPQGNQMVVKTRSPMMKH